MYDKLKCYLKDIILDWLIPTPFISRKTRVIICRKLGAQIADNARIFPGCRIKRPKGFIIGFNSFLNDRCIIFNEYAQVNIGVNCSIGPEVMLCTTTHLIGGEECRVGDIKGAPIFIDDGCWIGVRSMILPGVVVGRGCIIAAGSVVNKNCEPNGLYAGVPAKRIMDLPINKLDK